MRKLYFLLFTFFAFNLSYGQVIITEIADPNNAANTGRFVEIHNVSSSDVDMTGWELKRWTNGNAEPTASSAIDLSSLANFQSGETAVIGKSGFEEVYGFPPSIVSSSASVDSNGDDQIAVFDSEGNVIDIFGVPGEDGTGTCHEFEDGRVERKATVTSSNSIWNEAEWNVWADSTVNDCTTHVNSPQTAPDDYDPGSWIGASSEISISIITPVNNTILSPGTQSTEISWSTLNPPSGAGVNILVNGAETANVTSPFVLQLQDGTSYDVTVNIDDNGNVVASDNVSFSVGILTQVADITALRADISTNGIGNYYEITGESYVNQTDSYKNRKWIQDSNSSSISGMLIYDEDGIIETTYSIGDAVTGLQGYTAEVYGTLRFIPFSDSGIIVSSGNTIAPRLVSISNLNADPDTYESTLIRIAGSVEFSDADGTTTFSNGSNYEITDGSTDTEGVANSTSVRTEFYGVFNSTIIPSDLQIVVGVAGQYNGAAQVYPRTLSDIEADGCYFKEGFTHNFDVVEEGLVVDAACWSTIDLGDVANTATGQGYWGLFGVVGDINWGIYYTSEAHSDYLISPRFSIVDGSTDGLSFFGYQQNDGYPEPIDVLVFDENLNNFLGTLSEDLIMPAANTDNYIFDLSAYEGEDVRIAFYTDTTNQWAVFIDDFQVTSFSSLGTNTPDQSITFEYFPNPVEDELTLKAQANIDSIEVLNILGQSLISLSPSVMEAKVDMSSLQTGAYFVRLSVQGKIDTFRVLKN
ncbi:MAG: hypothetical protein CMP78_01775 [Formosa sp.]|nr:hypothetical protein [Formosa sp.]